MSIYTNSMQTGSYSKCISSVSYIELIIVQATTYIILATLYAQVLASQASYCFL